MAFSPTNLHAIFRSVLWSVLWIRETIGKNAKKREKIGKNGENGEKWEKMGTNEKKWEKWETNGK